MEKRTITVDPKYVSNWTVVDAIREIIQNSLDTHTEVDFNKIPCGTMWEISDSGPGVKAADFLIGTTSKDDQDRGQFGEGLPLACLVLARLKRQVMVLAGGYGYRLAIEHDQVWDHDLLAVTIEEAPNGGGTKVAFEATDDEMAQARDLFVEFNPPSDDEGVVVSPVSTQGIDLYATPGWLYVSGIRVSPINSLLSYNTRNKTMVNRDRKMVSHTALNEMISGALQGLDNQKFITLILRPFKVNQSATLAEKYLEHQAYFYPTHAEAWKRVIRRLWGNRSCLVSDVSAHNTFASELGWTLIPFSAPLTWSLQHIYQTATMIATQRWHPRRISIKTLPSSQYDKLKMAKSISRGVARDQGGFTFYPIKIVDKIPELSEATNNSLAGYFDRAENSVGLPVKLLDEPLDKVVGTIIHEQVHGEGLDDHTRAFESRLSDLMGRLAVKAYNGEDPPKRSPRVAQAGLG